MPTNSPIPLSPDTPTTDQMSSPDNVNISKETNINQEPHQNFNEGDEHRSETDEEEDAIINSFRGMLNPIQYGGGDYGPPYSFSLISPERLEVRPSNFLTFSFYLLAIIKI